jgi:hypothetical protein
MCTSRFRPSAWLGGTAALLGLSLGIAAAVAPAAAEKVGVAAAVNPDAFSSLAGAPKSQISIGKSIFYNEQINTTGSGLVQVLLVDGSTFTVGPGSDLVIDRFVYDPKKGVGQISASFSKGVMRFVGGKISKQEGGVNVDTPAGALAIRGGIVYADFKSSKTYSILFVFGEYAKLGNQTALYEPGNGYFSSNGQIAIKQFTAADLKNIMTSLTNSNTADATGTQSQGGTKPQVVETLSLQDLVADATTEQIITEAQNQPTETVNETPPHDDGTAPPPPKEVTVRVLTAPGVYTAFPLIDDDSFTTEDGHDAGILGGGTYPAETTGPKADDFEMAFTFQGDRLIGNIEGMTDAECDDGDCDTVLPRIAPPALVDLPAEFDNPDETCALGAICPVIDAKITQNPGTENEETETLVGIAVLKDDFFAYHLVNEPEVGDEDWHPEPILAFGGKGYDFKTPQGRTYAFLLTPDVKEAVVSSFRGENLPIGFFGGGGSSPLIPTDEAGNPIGPLPANSRLLYLEKDSASANDPSKAVWLQTGLYINTTPGNGDNIATDQQSWVNVALGGVDPETGGLIGARRGGAAVDFIHENDGCDGPCPITREAFAFTGDIASLKGPDGSHFIGKDDPNIVIGFDSTGTHNIGRDIPLDPDISSVENQSGSTYHIGVGLGTVPDQDQTGDTFNGYAVGLIQSDTRPIDGRFVNPIATRSLNDFRIAFDAVRNSVSADITAYDVGDFGFGFFRGGDPATTAYHFGFGANPSQTISSSQTHLTDYVPDGASAFINDNNYAALERPDAARVFNAGGPGYPPGLYDNVSAQGYIVSGEMLGVTKFFPDTFEPDPVTGHRPFCANCDFLKWGAWGARVAYQNDPSESDAAPIKRVDNVHLGWWAAAPLSSAGSPAADIDMLAAQSATATYSGNVLGDVAKLNGNQWQSYVAAGDLDMTWRFASRRGELAISNFDGRSFQTSYGGLRQTNPAVNQFTGFLGGDGLSGNVRGSFANDLSGNPARGVIGNWNVGSQNYRATGIFAGSGTPQVPQ